jgi:hypothetical protein
MPKVGTMSFPGEKQSLAMKQVEVVRSKDRFTSAVRKRRNTQQIMN